MILDKGVPASARFLLAGAIALAATSCGRQSAPEPAGSAARSASAGSAQVKVAATISTLAALIKAVGGDNVDVFSIVPLGVSPETYDPAPRDLVNVAHADLIVENGAGLELWLEKVLRSAANPKARVLVLSDGMPVAGATAKGEPGNPHLWLDPIYAQAYVRKIAQALREIDPANAAAYSANERREIANLAELDRWIRAQVASIPPDQRSMITFHDAWLYFDRRYGLRDIGAIEPSPGQQPSAAYLAALIEQARANHVRAIFAEPQFSPKLAAQLAASAGIKTVSDLYDDTLGTTPQLQTYEGMMRYDVDTIVKALRP
jgi:manganese/iron transport system substrate-binding protein